MQLEGIVQGIADVAKKVEEMKRRSDVAIKKGVGLVASRFRDVAKDFSVAGHPEHPNRITGRLHESIRYKMVNDNTARVASDAIYARAVEFGRNDVPSWHYNETGATHATKPYPYFRPAITQVFDGGEASKLFQAAVKETLQA
jgi:hypothetical protein